jgi:hypothetical protein
MPKGSSSNEVSESDKESILEYQTTEFGPLNEHLRNDDPLTPRDLRIRMALDHAMTKTTQEKVVYRFIGEGGEQDLLDAGVGGEITDKGFTSTSRDEEFVKDMGAGGNQGFYENGKWTFLPKGYIGKITIPKGTKIVETNKITNQNAFKHEKEVLIDRNGTYRVDKLDEKYKTYELTKIR